MNGIKQQLKGKVVSDAMDKTIVVECTRYIKHPRYKKYIRRSKKYHAHDEANRYQKGEKVIIEATRPFSKTKRWKVVDIPQKEK